MTEFNPGFSLPDLDVCLAGFQAVVQASSASSRKTARPAIWSCRFSKLSIAPSGRGQISCWSDSRRAGNATRKGSAMP